MENPPSPRRGRKPQSGARVSGHSAGAGGHRGSRPSGKGNKRPPLLPDTCYRWGKEATKKAQDCKAVDTTCRGCGKKGHYEKVCLKGEMLHTLSESSTGQLCRGRGQWNPFTSMMRDNQCTLIMVSVPHVNKHLIKFPIALDYYGGLTYRAQTVYSYGAESMENTEHGIQSTDGVFHMAHFSTDCVAQGRHRGRHQISWTDKHSINSLEKPKEYCNLHLSRWKTMENMAVKVLGMFHAFLRWKDKGYKQLFLCDRLWQIPKFAVKGCLLHSWCSKTVLHCGEFFKSNSEMHQTKVMWWPNHLFIRKWMEVKWNCPTIPTSGLSTRANFKAVHWLSMHSLTSTLMFLLG